MHLNFFHSFSRTAQHMHVLGIERRLAHLDSQELEEAMRQSLTKERYNEVGQDIAQLTGEERGRVFETLSRRITRAPAQPNAPRNADRQATQETQRPDRQANRQTQTADVPPPVPAPAPPAPRESTGSPGNKKAIFKSGIEVARDTAFAIGGVGGLAYAATNTAEIAAFSPALGGIAKGVSTMLSPINWLLGGLSPAFAYVVAPAIGLYIAGKVRLGFIKSRVDRLPEGEEKKKLQARLDSIWPVFGTMKEGVVAIGGLFYKPFEFLTEKVFGGTWETIHHNITSAFKNAGGGFKAVWNGGVATAKWGAEQGGHAAIGGVGALGGGLATAALLGGPFAAIPGAIIGGIWAWRKSRAMWGSKAAKTS